MIVILGAATRLRNVQVMIRPKQPPHIKLRGCSVLATSTAWGLKWHSRPICPSQVICTPISISLFLCGYSKPRSQQLSMCHRRKTQYRCGHQVYSGGITYCSKAGKGPSGKKTMCHTSTTTTIGSSGEICGKSSCQLSVIGGKWKCCKCNESGNRHPLCVNGTCNHVICQSCRAS